MNSYEAYLHGFFRYIRVCTYLTKLLTALPKIVNHAWYKVPIVAFEQLD